MMRRFSRRRRQPAGDVAINGQRVFARMLEEGILDLARLEVMAAETIEEVPDSYAAIGQGEDKNGRPVLVSFAPRSAGDALLAGLIAASKQGGDTPFEGEVFVVSPNWNRSARRRLALVPDSGFKVRPVAAPTLADSPVEVTPVHERQPGVVPVGAAAQQIANANDRELFARAAAALEGLASKHGGAIRGFGRSVELVLMARRVAELRADDSGVVLDTILPARSSAKLASDSLAGVLDGLEGNLRKRLNDRRTREGDEGVRARLQPLVAQALELRSLVSWPVGGKDLDVIDSVGVNGSGVPVATAARGSLSLAALGVVLDAALELRAALPVLLAGAEAPVRLDGFRLALIAREFAPGVAKVLPLLNLSHDLLEIRTNARDRGLEVAICGSGEAVPIATGRGRRGRGGDRGRRGRGGEGAAVEKSQEQDKDQDREKPRGRGKGAVEAKDAGQEGAETDGDATAKGEGNGRGRSRRRGRRGRGGERRGAEGGDAEDSAAAEAAVAEGEGAEPTRKAKPRFEEMSSFDLADDARDDDGDDGRSRRRGRRSRGRRRKGGDGAEAEDRGGDTKRERGARADAGAAAKAGKASEGDDDDDALLEQGLSELPDEVEDEGAAAPVYDDEEEETESPAHARDKRRRGRKPEAEKEAPTEPPKPPRRRVAIVAHADRDSLLAAVLLARELRLLEGIWVYTQAELMSFFRGGATDLREDTPIYLIGFTPSPAGDVVQAAAIYAGRLTWIDHREWPPEDLGALKQALGEDQIHVKAGLESSLPLLIEGFTRRSRFSDKLVDLAAGRFTEHDYERWGRVWWYRLGELAKQSGSRQRDLEPLLAGRPSDLAKEAARAELPPPPPEVDFVSKQDFRLVHFAGQSMIILDVPAELDLNLAARIARERYSASLSLATRAEGNLVVVSGDEGAGRRTLDFASMVDHLADKLEWVDGLPDDDHVARFIVQGRAENPGRLDDVISEIVMGRTLLDR
ncbi:MAG: hypothetical protein QF570_10775 [Myxococcota bacterium]|jgi:hypothetical protein|nr:hypothetical protein [Myxococcota bacterium]